jgi:hypothetical protein
LIVGIFIEIIKQREIIREKEEENIKRHVVSLQDSHPSEWWR